MRFSTRKCLGEDVPILTLEQKKCFFGEHPAAWTRIFDQNIELTALGAYPYQEGSYAIDVEEAIMSDFKVKGKWSRKVRAYFPPGGQLKNFYNAALVAMHLKDGEKMIIMGSSSGAASGIWLRMLAHWLNTRVTDVTIHAYDVHEVEDSEIVGTIKIISHKESYIGTGQEFDALVDDIYVNEARMAKSYKSRHYSYKTFVREQGAIPFLHDSEYRVFSSPMVPLKEGCQCQRCRVESCLPYITVYGDIIEPSPCRLKVQELESAKTTYLKMTADELRFEETQMAERVSRILQPITTLPSRPASFDPELSSYKHLFVGVSAVEVEHVSGNGPTLTFIGSLADMRAVVGDVASKFLIPGYDTLFVKGCWSIQRRKGQDIKKNKDNSEKDLRKLWCEKCGVGCVHFSKRLLKCGCEYTPYFVPEIWQQQCFKCRVKVMMRKEESGLEFDRYCWIKHQDKYYVRKGTVYVHPDEPTIARTNQVLEMPLVEVQKIKFFGDGGEGYIYDGVLLQKKPIIQLWVKRKQRWCGTGVLPSYTIGNKSLKTLSWLHCMSALKKSAGARFQEVITEALASASWKFKRKINSL